MRRAFVTLHIYFDHNGNFIATNRSIANATTTLRENTIYTYFKRRINLPRTHCIKYKSYIII